MQTPKPIKGILAVYNGNDEHVFINTQQIVQFSEMVEHQMCKIVMTNNTVVFYKSSLVDLLSALIYSNP